MIQNLQEHLLEMDSNLDLENDNQLNSQKYSKHQPSRQVLLSEVKEQPDDFEAESFEEDIEPFNGQDEQECLESGYHEDSLSFLTDIGCHNEDQLLLNGSAKSGTQKEKSEAKR